MTATGVKEIPLPTKPATGIESAARAKAAVSRSGAIRSPFARQSPGGTVGHLLAL
jgi:hypothetical protein